MLSARQLMPFVLDDAIDGGFRRRSDGLHEGAHAVPVHRPVSADGE